MLENISYADVMRLEALLTMAEIEPDTFFAVGGIPSEPVIITGDAEPIIKLDEICF